MANEKVVINVFRYDPDRDDAPRFERHEIPFKKGMTILDALRYISDNIDPSLAYRWNCRTGQCGSCAITINDKPGLACRTRIDPGQTYTLRPLERMPVIRDLAVDLSKGIKRLEKIRPYLERRAPPKRPEILLREEVADAAELRSCIECFSCLNACPAAGEAWQEFAGPVVMGRIARFELDPRDADDRVRLAFSNGLYDCTSCGVCKEVCMPHHLDIRRKAIERLRAHAVEEGLGPLEGHKSFIENASKTGYAIEVISTPLVEMVPDVIEPENAVDEVFFFPGCLINLRLQNTGLNAIEVLKRNGVRVRIPKEFVCCSSVMFRSGARKTAYELVKKNVEYFRRLGVKKLVGLCPGCMSTIKQDWPIVLHQLGEKPYEFEAYDINEYLVDVLGVDKMNLKELHPLKMKVTYHAPCHLNRHQEISQQPITLLKLVPGLEYVKTDGEDLCCGAGGGVRAGRRELSYRIADQKVKRMAKTGADAFVTSCSFCTIQLMDAVKRLNLPQKVYNVADVLAMSYKKA